MKKPNRFPAAIYFSLGTVILLLVSNSVLAQNQSSLEDMRELYQMHTPENFDDGGLISRYVWKNFASFYPHATIARTSALRPLKVATNNAVASFQVTTESGVSSLHDYVK